MISLVFVVLLAAFCLASTWVAVHALSNLVGDGRVVVRVAPKKLFMACFVVALIGSVADGAIAPSSVRDFGLPILLVWAVITAYIDKVTAWVTDISVVFLLVGALLHDPYASAMAWVSTWSFLGLDQSDLLLFAGSAVLAVTFWAICLLAFKIQALFNHVALTAVDCVAVVLPIIAFGLSFEACISYVLIVLIIALAGKNERVHSWLSNGSALREGLDDLHQSHVPVTRALPAFTIFAPVTAGVSIAKYVQFA
jgi:hypothetical protein